MNATIYRKKRVAEGWINLEPIDIWEIPDLAMEFARSRQGGPLTATDEEIVRACTALYERASERRAQMGDIVVTRVEVHR